jgi:hypothetical protein
VLFEMQVPWSELNASSWKRNAMYRVECAVDEGDQQGRVNQIRWNSSMREGFHQNPSLWGFLQVK